MCIFNSTLHFWLNLSKNKMDFTTHYTINNNINFRWAYVVGYENS